MCVRIRMCMCMWCSCGVHEVCVWCEYGVLVCESGCARLSHDLILKSLPKVIVAVMMLFVWFLTSVCLVLFCMSTEILNPTQIFSPRQIYNILYVYIILSYTALIM